jgi:hypothetical protein
MLVGYFRTSGFYLMYPTMENVEKIRVLVGLNVDGKTVQIIEKAVESMIMIINKRAIFSILTHFIEKCLKNRL